MARQNILLPAKTLQIKNLKFNQSRLIPPFHLLSVELVGSRNQSKLIKRETGIKRGSENVFKWFELREQHPAKPIMQVFRLNKKNIPKLYAYA